MTGNVDWLSTADAAKALGITTRTSYRFINHVGERSYVLAQFSAVCVAPTEELGLEVDIGLFSGTECDDLYKRAFVDLV